jgi:3-phosphoshikimate 1-carboxyvinyltransferase
MIPRLIDELPIIMVVATQAEGTTVIENASELRVKETDRINSMVVNLKKMGADIEVEEDTVIIHGPTRLRGNIVDSFADHRTAMSLVITGLIASGQTKVTNTSCIDTSFPSFKATLKQLI